MVVVAAGRTRTWGWRCLFVDGGRIPRTLRVRARRTGERWATIGLRREERGMWLEFSDSWQVLSSTMLLIGLFGLL